MKLIITQKAEKALFLLLLVIIASGSILSYILTKSLTPWDFINGVKCPLSSSRCSISLKNYYYYYWINRAVNTNNINLCDNITEKETYDLLGDSKQSAMNDCRGVYMIKTENIDLCLKQSYENVCLLGLAKRLKRQDLCKLIDVSENIVFEQRLIQLCEDNIINDHDNNLIAY